MRLIDVTTQQAESQDNQVCYEAEVALAKCGVTRVLLQIGGMLSLALGLLGIFLPILPTTPFLLLTAACWARSSRRFYVWLMTNRIFGSYIHNWRKHGVIPKNTKLYAIALITVTMSTSIIFFIPMIIGQITMGLIGIAVICYLYRMPTDINTNKESILQTG